MANSLLMKDPLLYDVAAAAHVLSLATKTPSIDAAHHLRQHPGILATGLERAAADDLLQRFLEKNIAAVVVPDSDLKTPPKAVLVSTLELQPLALTLQGPNGPAHVPWEQIAVISTCILRVNSARTVTAKEGPSAGEKILKTSILLTTGIPLPMGKTRDVRKTVTDSDTQFFLDLFFRSTPLRIRLRADTTHYDFLGTEKAMSATENFRTLTIRLARLATNAIRNKSTQIWIEHQPVAPVVCESEAIFDQECRWLMALSKQNQA